MHQETNLSNRYFRLDGLKLVEEEDEEGEGVEA